MKKLFAFIIGTGLILNFKMAEACSPIVSDIVYPKNQQTEVPTNGRILIYSIAEEPQPVLKDPTGHSVALQKVTNFGANLPGEGQMPANYYLFKTAEELNPESTYTLIYPNSFYGTLQRSFVTSSSKDNDAPEFQSFSGSQTDHHNDGENVLANDLFISCTTISEIPASQLNDPAFTGQYTLNQNLSDHFHVSLELNEFYDVSGEIFVALYREDSSGSTLLESRFLDSSTSEPGSDFSYTFLEDQNTQIQQATYRVYAMDIFENISSDPFALSITLNASVKAGPTISVSGNQNPISDSSSGGCQMSTAQTSSNWISWAISGLSILALLCRRWVKINLNTDCSLNSPPLR